MKSFDHWTRTNKKRSVIQTGPLSELLGTFKSLFGEKASNTREEARQAASKLGWFGGKM